jgi:hypothetical protein
VNSFLTILLSWSSQQKVSMYWKSVQPCWLSEKAFRLDMKAISKIVGEFLKACVTWVQVNCPFSPVQELSHWKEKMGWLCVAIWMQKNASLRSRQVKNFASGRIRLKSVYKFGTTGYKITLAELTTWRYSVKMLWISIWA